MGSAGLVNRCRLTGDRSAHDSQPRLFVSRLIRRAIVVLQDLKTRGFQKGLIDGQFHIRVGGQVHHARNASLYISTRPLCFVQAQSHQHPPRQDRLRGRPHRLPSLNQEIVGIVHTKVKNRCFDRIVLMMRERLAETGAV